MDSWTPKKNKLRICLDLATWANVPTSWRRLSNSFPLSSYMLFSVSVADVTLESVPGSSLTRKAPAYGACRLRLSTKAASNLGSCKITSIKYLSQFYSQINWLGISIASIARIIWPSLAMWVDAIIDWKKTIQKSLFFHQYSSHRTKKQQILYN